MPSVTLWLGGTGNEVGWAVTSAMRMGLPFLPRDRRPIGTATAGRPGTRQGLMLLHAPGPHNANVRATGRAFPARPARPPAYTGTHGDSTARPDGTRGVRDRDGDVADLRRSGSRPGPARDGCGPRRRRQLLRLVADVRRRRAGAGTLARLATDARGRRDQGLGGRRPRGARADSPGARAVRRRRRPRPGPQPHRLGGPSAVPGGVAGPGRGSRDRDHALECRPVRSDGGDRRGGACRNDPGPVQSRGAPGRAGPPAAGRRAGPRRDRDATPRAGRARAEGAARARARLPRGLRPPDVGAGAPELGRERSAGQREHPRDRPAPARDRQLRRRPGPALRCRRPRPRRGPGPAALMFLLDARTARATWTVLVFAVGIALVWLLRDVLLLFAFSLFFAYLIFPLVRVVERGLGPASRRALAIGVVYLVLLVGLGTAAASVVPRRTRGAAGLAQPLPEPSQQIESGQIVGHMFPVPGWGDERGRQLERLVRLHAPQIVGYAQQAAAGLLRWLSGAWVIVLIPVFAFFILRDAERAVGGIEALIENPAHRRLWYDIADDVNRLFGEYVRALIILSVITFVVWSLLFFLTGVPYALVLAAIGGGLEVSPVLGPPTAGVIVGSG